MRAWTTHHHRRAYTLLELLSVMSLSLVLMSAVASSWNSLVGSQAPSAHRAAESLSDCLEQAHLDSAALGYPIAVVLAPQTDPQGVQVMYLRSANAAALADWPQEGNYRRIAFMEVPTSAPTFTREGVEWTLLAVARPQGGWSLDPAAALISGPTRLEVSVKRGKHRQLSGILLHPASSRALVEQKP